MYGFPVVFHSVNDWRLQPFESFESFSVFGWSQDNEMRRLPLTSVDWDVTSCICLATLFTCDVIAAKLVDVHKIYFFKP